MVLVEIPGEFTVVRFEPSHPVPEWVFRSQFYSLSHTEDELSIVCESALVPRECQTVEASWKALKVEGPLDFSLTGILSSIAKPLADQKISIFAISTFDTDYILVKAGHLSASKKCLRENNFQVL